MLTKGAYGINTAAIVGSYVPRQCGIATFTKDLRDSIAPEIEPQNTLVLAMDDRPDGYPYSSEVTFQIRAHQINDYWVAADLLNINQIDVAIIQHEFGIYGGQDGSLILELIRRLRMPTITTLHTVLPNPTPGQAKVIKELGFRSDRLVVMSHLAEKMLEEIYDVPSEKVAYVPHGIPDVPFIDPSFYKDQFGTEGRTVLLTFGLLSSGKGIEHAIQALPAIVEHHPDIMYLILGATHPHVLAREGDSYRNSLERLVDKLGLWNNVRFHNRFVTLEELCGYIGAADVYVTPSSNPAQITSGTLAYSMGAGKAVVCTPYLYAQEMLADERGYLFPFGDPDSLARSVIHLLDNEVERSAMRKRAYMFCRPMVWREVGRSYLEVAQQTLIERREKPRNLVHVRPAIPRIDSIPEVDLRHLRTLSDDTGILQHAIYTVPDRRYGYCTDDNARALIATLLYYNLRQDPSILPLTLNYLSFLHGAFDQGDGHFRNFLSYERQWTDGEDGNLEDVHGRALWAVGMAAALAPIEGVSALATRLFHWGLPLAETLISPRAWAFALVGAHAYLRRFGGDAQVRNVRKMLAEKLYDLFKSNATKDWPWCEDIVTYDNAKLAHALILSGQWIPDGGMFEQGLEALKWLIDVQVFDSTVSIIGNQGWMHRDGQRARFDQQPIEAMALIEACSEAYRCTGDKWWSQQARLCLGWFLGNNDVQAVLYDFKTGGCRDGLQADGANQNEGAESTLAWLISLITIHQMLKEEGVSLTTLAQSN